MSAHDVAGWHDRPRRRRWPPLAYRRTVGAVVKAWVGAVVTAWVALGEILP